MKWLEIISEKLGLQRQALFEMSNLTSSDTGLPFVVFVSQKAGAKHDIRVKVGQSTKYIPGQEVTVALRPFRVIGKRTLRSSDLAALKTWVDINMTVLLDYWNGDISTRQMLDRIQKI